MKAMLAATALLSLLASPAAAIAQPQSTTLKSASSAQSVFRSETVIAVENDDGTISHTVVVTRYYFLGFE